MPNTKFTLKEANKSLVFFGPIVEELVSTFKSLKIVNDELKNVSSIERKEELDGYYTSHSNRISVLTKEFHNTGVELRDFEIGSISFAGIHKKQDVIWFWRCGDKSILYWYLPEETSEHKKPIDTLP